MMTVLCAHIIIAVFPEFQFDIFTNSQNMELPRKNSLKDPFPVKQNIRGVNLKKFLGVFFFKKFFLGSSLSRPSYLRRG
jgi:hypothetical protein